MSKTHNQIEFGVKSVNTNNKEHVVFSTDHHLSAWLVQYLLVSDVAQSFPVQKHVLVLSRCQSLALEQQGDAFLQGSSDNNNSIWMLKHIIYLFIYLLNMSGVVSMCLKDGAY